MSLLKRLVTSFFMMVILPLALATVALTGLTKFYANSLESKYEIESSEYEMIGSSVQLTSRYSKAVYDTLVYKLKENPDALKEEAYVKAIESDLEQKASFMIIRQDNVITHVTKDEDISKLEKALPGFGDENINNGNCLYIGNDVDCMIRQLDYVSSSGAKCSVFLVTPAQRLSPEIKSFAFQALIVVLCILIFTSLVLCWWIYNGIVTPIQKLKEATQRIKEGNLDFTLTSESQDEIGELFENFDEMRSILKSNAEEKLEIDKENKELISNISHDLKTPITAVKGYVEGIMDGVADTPEKMDKYIRTIYNKANEMDVLINELTLYCKIDTNRIPYTFKKISVQDFFTDCAEELSLDLESRNIELTFDNSVDPEVLVIADSEQLSRVVHNIVGNSAKYIDKEKGFINFRIKDVGDFIQVEIEDNGKGIAQKDLQYIFDRFYRTDASRNSSQGGSGIGLSIVKKIIEDHGGKVWASSREGEGTTMYFVLRKYQEVINNEQNFDSRR